MECKQFILCFLSSLFFFTNFLYSQDNTQTEKKSESKKSYFRSTITENSHILTIMASNNRYPVLLQNESLLLKKRFSKDFNKFSLVDALYINYQYSFKKNIFFEFGFKYLTNEGGFHLDFNPIGVNYDYSIGGNVSNSYSFDFGSGYRIMVNKNLRIIDIHFGISYSIIDNSIGSGGEMEAHGKLLNKQSNELVYFDLTNQYKVIKRMSFGVYIGASKDIKLTKNLYASIRYHYYFGRWSKFAKQEINYSVSSPIIEEKSIGFLTGEGQMISLGLRWYFK